MNNWSPDVYNKAWEYASLAHQHQTYGGRNQGVQVNYLNHLASVAMEVIGSLRFSQNMFDENLAVQCALLHDIIEDTRHSYNDLQRLFGKKVADGVLSLTKNANLVSSHDQIVDSLERIKKQPVEVWVVKMADRICNLYHPPHYWNKEKIVLYQQESKLIYHSLKDADAYLANRLKNKIDEYSSFANH